MRLILLLGIACVAFFPFNADAQISINCSEANLQEDPFASAACADDFALLELLALTQPNVARIVRATKDFGQLTFIQSIRLTIFSDCLIQGRIGFFPFFEGFEERQITIFVNLGSLTLPPEVRVQLRKLEEGRVVLQTLSRETQIACERVSDVPPLPCPEPEVLTFNPELPDNCTPILLDFGAFGFDLTGAAGGVSFDIDADGTPETVSWTQGDSLDAFLALDRNANGIVDDGGELFGNATPLVDGTLAPHGYAALAELDLPAQGGNGNGHIDRTDRVYPRLLLWTDTNHDGVSDPIELTTLESRGVVAIRTEARRSPATDEHGNRFSLVSLAYVKNRVGLRTILTSDVSFTQLAPR